MQVVRWLFAAEQAFRHKKTDGGISRNDVKCAPVMGNTYGS